MDKKEQNKDETKPKDTVKVTASDHLKIIDVSSGKTILDKRG
jgi:hypothetical protein